MRQSDIRNEEQSLNLLLLVILGLSIVIIPVLESIKFATGFLVFLAAALTVLLFVERMNRRAAQSEPEDLEISSPRKQHRQLNQDHMLPSSPQTDYRAASLPIPPALD